MITSCQGIFLFNALAVHAGSLSTLVWLLSFLFLIVAACYKKSRTIALSSLLALPVLICLAFTGLGFLTAAFLVLGYPIVIYIIGLRFPRPIPVLCALPTITLLFMLGRGIFSYLVIDMEVADACYSTVQERGSRE